MCEPELNRQELFEITKQLARSLRDTHPKWRQLIREQARDYLRQLLGHEPINPRFKVHPDWLKP